MQAAYNDEHTHLDMGYFNRILEKVFLKAPKKIDLM